MKNTLLKITALAAAVMMAAASFGCKNDKEANRPDPTNVPIVTANPEANITAGPTATPFEPTSAPDHTDVPVVTENPEANITAGPTATPFEPTPAHVWTNVPIVTADPSSNVTAGPTATPFEPTPAPVWTNVPIVTADPSANVTAGPTATPYAPQPTPAPTNVPVVTAAPTAQITAGPTPTPVPTPTPTNVPIVTANPTAQVTAGPTATPTPAPTPRPSQGVPPAPTPEAPNGLSIVYTGETVDCTGLKVGDTFFWTVDLSNVGSCLITGMLLIDYPEEYLEPVAEAFNPNWSGGLKYLIEQSWDDEEATSDNYDLYYNAVYEGATGPNPYGYAGNMYSILLIQDSSVSPGSVYPYGGIQAAGHIARLKFRVKALPGDPALYTDAGGRFLPIQIGVLASYGWLNGQTVTHGSITANHGKLYFGH